MHKQFLIMTVLSGCGAVSDMKLKVSGYDCPAPEQLASGVTVKCGDHDVTGTQAATVSALPACADDGQTDCTVSGDFKAVAKAKLDPTNIRSGVVVGGVTGTVEGASLCIFDGQDDCIVSGTLKAAETNGLAEKVVAGTRVAEVSGIAVTNPPELCQSNAAVGCLAHDAYQAVEASRMPMCLGTGLNLTTGITLEATSWDDAVATCKRRGQKLPGKRDLMRAYLENSAEFDQTFPIWSADAEETEAWTVNPSTGAVGLSAKGDKLRATCVQ